jgi:hypothetical protein
MADLGWDMARCEIDLATHADSVLTICTPANGAEPAVSFSIVGTAPLLALRDLIQCALDEATQRLELQGVDVNRQVMLNGD